MFGKRPERPIGQGQRVHEKSGKGGYPISMLGDGCSFKGKMFLQGEARVGGHIEGLIVSEGSLTIEETARIIGDVKGVTIQASGYVEGSITASGLLRVTAKARVKGGITAPRLIVEDGAHICGKVLTEEEATQAAVVPIREKAAS